MEINPKEITIRELVKNYQDNGNEGVSGFGGKLNIRPPYQREFVYKDKQRNLVINSINNAFPLNIMYWFVSGIDKYEIIDGQQRTISICQYIKNEFSLDGMSFDNIQDDAREKILNYKLRIYQCEGTDTEKLDWFKRINVIGERLTDQELRNAAYSGPWVTDAKRHFSKHGCAASGLASDYMSGSAIRQDYLATAIKWISKNKVLDYMSKHQREQNADELWLYFQAVINWVKSTFVGKRPHMTRGVNWGDLYDNYKDAKLDTGEIEKEIKELIEDDEVTNQKGIYTYVLTRETKHLSLRGFDRKTKQKTFELQNGICPKCDVNFEYNEMEGDHIKPWSKGGKTILENCQMLCGPCNKRWSDK